MIILRIFSNQAGEIIEEAIGLEILGENRARQVLSYSFMLKLNENNFYKNIYIKINFLTICGLVASVSFFFDPVLECFPSLAISESSYG